MDYNSLNKDYPLFVFDSFSAEIKNDALNVEFLYKIENLDNFITKWSFPLNGHSADLNALEPLLISLGMAEMISYWKITCSPMVQINTVCLTNEQKNWWKKLFYHGLGEFFYVNNINTTLVDFMNIESPPSAAPLAFLSSESFDTDSSFLIPVGGGKDSIVTLELLKPFVSISSAYIINYRDSAYSESKIAGFSDEQIITPTRKFDEKITYYNKKGFLNGHTPFSSVIAFSSLITATMHGKRNIALSNEASANEPSILGSNINHQYSKSFEFEQDFDYYVKHFLRSNVRYFSFLRVFHEIQIAAIFSGLTQYHSVFRSCNVGSKTDSWCGKCAKCLFVFTILSPFLTTKALVDIFGVNLFENASLYPILLELAGKTNNKPFECVGTVSEVEYALALTLNNTTRKGEELPVLLERYKTDYSIVSTKQENFFGYFGEENLVPKEFIQLLKSSRDEVLNEYSGY